MNYRHHRNCACLAVAMLGALSALPALADTAPAPAPAGAAPAPAPAPAAEVAGSCASVAAKLADPSWTAKELIASCSDDKKQNACGPADFERVAVTLGFPKKQVIAYCKTATAPGPASTQQAAAVPSGTVTQFTLAQAVELFPQVGMKAYQATADGVEGDAIELPEDFPLEIIDASSTNQPPGAQAGEKYVEVAAGCHWHISLIAHPDRCNRSLKLSVDKGKKTAVVGNFSLSALAGADKASAPPQGTGDTISGTHLLVKASDLATPANVDGSYLTYGAVYIPFRFRRYDHNFDTTPLTIAGSVGLAEKGDQFAINWLAFLGPSTVNVAAAPATPAAAATASKAATAVTFGLGAILDRVTDSHWNVGVFVGWDHLAGGDGAAWRYDRKVWYSVGLGYSLSADKETVAPTATPAAH